MPSSSLQEFFTEANSAGCCVCRMSVDLGGLPAMVWGSPPLKSFGGKQRSWKCQSLTLLWPCAAGMVKHMIHVQPTRCYMQWNGAPWGFILVVGGNSYSIQHHQWQRGKLGLLEGSGIHARLGLHHHSDRLYSGWGLTSIVTALHLVPVL